MAEPPRQKLIVLSTFCIDYSTLQQTAWIDAIYLSLNALYKMSETAAVTTRGSSIVQPGVMLRSGMYYSATKLCVPATGAPYYEL